MKVICPHCRKRYRLKKPPSVRRTIPCPACKGAMPIIPASTAAHAAGDTVVEIECLHCQKKYRIPKARIPVGRATAQCKACGQKIDINIDPPESKGAGMPEAGVKKAAAEAPVPPAPGETAQAPTSRPAARRSWWKLAMIGGALAVVAAVSILFFRSPLIREKTPVAPSGPLPEALNPVAGIRVDVPRLTRLVAQQAEKSEKGGDALEMIDRMKYLKLDRIDIFVFPDTTHTALAAVALRGGRGFVIDHVLKDDQLLGPFVEKVEKGRYRFKAEAFSADARGDFPVELYELRLKNSDCFIAPRALFEMLPPGRDLIADAPAARFAGAVESKDNLAVLAVRFPRDFGEGWEQRLAGHTLWQQVPQAGMFAGLGVMLLQQFTEPFKQLEFMALGLRADDGRQRRLSYSQQFRPEVDGAAVYHRLQGKDASMSPGVVGSMVRLLEDPRLETGVKFNANRLTLNIGWDKENDRGVLTALSQATVGQMFARSMMSGGEPTSGQVATVYHEPPLLTPEVDGARLKRELPRQIGMALFPDHFWQDGDEPNMTLELDPVAVPNAGLADVEYELLSVQAPDGRNILRSADQPYKSPVDLAGRYSSRIRLDVVQGTLPADLAKARLRFQLALPSKLSIFEFKVDEASTTQAIDGIQATAERIERDIAQVTARGGGDIWLYAFDHTGRALSPKESMGSAGSKFARFSGLIQRLQVVVAAETLDHAFEIDVPLNGGRRIELRHKPQVPPRVRLDPTPVTRHTVFTARELDDLKVEWIEGPKVWSQGLEVKLPRGPFSGKAQWEVYFFGADKALNMDGTPMWSGDTVGYSVNREKLGAAHAAFGKVSLQVAEKIETLHFMPGQGKNIARQKISTGGEIRLAFNQNEIVYKPGKAEVIQVRAFDDRNRRLKMDNYANSRKGAHTRYFWGLPTRVEMDVATRHVKRLIHFDLRPRTVNSKAYDTFKQEVDGRQVVVKILKQIYQARRKVHKRYGEDLAGFYYLVAKGAEPVLDRAVALSDPNGQARFGYKARAFNGYYFTVLPKSRDDLAKMAQTRQKRGVSYNYKGQDITALSVRDLPNLAAIPADKSKPTFFLNWGRVYMKYLDGLPLKHVPANYYNTDWKEVKLIEK